jgi:hypothetical protein
MSKPYMREVLLRELRTHRVSVDRLASYLLVMTEMSAPCPRCYADGSVVILVITAPNDGTEQASCERCSALFISSAS